MCKFNQLTEMYIQFPVDCAKCPQQERCEDFDVGVTVGMNPLDDAQYPTKKEVLSLMLKSLAVYWAATARETRVPLQKMINVLLDEVTVQAERYDTNTALPSIWAPPKGQRH